MGCGVAGCVRFSVLAGPDLCADLPEAVHEFRLAALRAGAERIWMNAERGTQFRFVLTAHTPEAACNTVTEILRETYGLNWWAEVTVDAPSRRASAALN